MTENFQKIILGTVSIGGVEAVNHVQLPTSTETKDIISIIVQLAIGILTIVRLFKKKKPV